MVRLILASSSPRRSQLLGLTGLSFEIARPDIDETPHPAEPPDAYVLRLSLEKAQAIARQHQQEPLQQHNATHSATLILSADTTVADGPDILGKPESPAEAAAMLRRLGGRAHFALTGLTVLEAASGRAVSRLSSSTVIMRPYTEDEIAAYVASGDPMGKAGSYAIQNQTFRPVAALQGCYTNVMGLPLCVLADALAEFGISLHEVVRCSDKALPCHFSYL